MMVLKVFETFESPVLCVLVTYDALSNESHIGSVCKQIDGVGVLIVYAVKM